MEQKLIPKKGLRWNPPGKRKQGRPKMTLRKPVRDTIKRWNWHGEWPREKQKRDIHGEKGVAALSWMDRYNQRRRRIECLSSKNSQIVELSICIPELGDTPSPSSLNKVFTKINVWERESPPPLQPFVLASYLSIKLLLRGLFYPPNKFLPKRIILCLLLQNYCDGICQFGPMMRNLHKELGIKIKRSNW